MTHLSPKKPLVLGVDPGIHGALAFLDANLNQFRAIIQIPTVKLKNGKTRIAIRDLSFLIDLYIEDTQLAIIEDVFAMPGQGVTSMFAFGESKGIVEGLLSHIPQFMVPPAVWKADFNLTKDKAQSRSLAQSLWPNHAHEFERVKDDGKAEACLLAKYGRRFW